ncbi:MAG TPA: SAM hydroxide adenosyltransferase [Opitutaceae bacterium]|jgi:pimeloyl-ACP methyl ester carboxylesterase|nr:SAM hydroxide adenosyltransferase [Opitutaceae bacterium]
MFRRLHFAAAFVFILPFFARAGDAPDTGEINGARFAIARPAYWNHGLLLLAHGYRPESAPLVADLDSDQPACRALLDEGWMIATTSYRRNGLIIGDAVADLDALRAYIAKTYGPPKRVLLEGESMGGTIVTLMAERDDELYSGAIAIDPALELHEPGQGLDLQPKIPLIFLANQTEISGARHYLSTNVPRNKDDPRPIILCVSRDGHANVNQSERLDARRTLIAWLEHGPALLPRPDPKTGTFDATHPAAPQPSQVAFAPDDHSFDARVTAIDAFTGNIILNAQSDDLARLGLGINSRFQLTAHGQDYRVLYGHDFSSAKRGAWVAFPSADGFFLVARNLGDAAGTAHLAVGDTVTLRRYEDAAGPQY